VTLFEAGADDRAHYLISECVEGVTLADLLAAGGLSDRDVARIATALAAALSHAHARGVIHRDVKPSNVLCPDSPTQDGGVAKLTDFGVAHMASDDALTRTGDVVGTLAYMAPEQAEGRRVGPQADLYALGIVIYEALSGSHPVRRAGPAATARRLGAVLPSLRRSRPDLPGELVDAVDRAVRPTPEERGTLDELRAALEGAVEVVSAADSRLPALPRRRPLPRGTGRAAAGLGAGALVVAAAAVGPTPPVEPAIAAGAVAATVALVPRLAWLAAAAAVIAWLALGAGGEPGSALVVACALAVSPALLPRAGRLWSAPALAPLLGLLMAGPAFAVLAGQARHAWRRAALGAAGAWWLALLEPLSGRTLLLGSPAGASNSEAWATSAPDAAADVVVALLTGRTAALAGLFAAAALALPWLVRGRSLTADGLAAAVWALGVGMALVSVSALGPEPVEAPRGGLTAVALAGAAAVAVRALRGPVPRPARLPPTVGESGEALH